LHSILKEVSVFDTPVANNDFFFSNLIDEEDERKTKANLNETQKPKKVVVEVKKKVNEKVKDKKSEKSLKIKNREKTPLKKKSDEDNTASPKKESAAHKPRSPVPSPMKNASPQKSLDELLHPLEFALSIAKSSPKKYNKSPINASPIKSSPKAKSPAKSSPMKVESPKKSPVRSSRVGDSENIVNEIFLSNLSPGGFGDEDEIKLVPIGKRRLTHDSPNKPTTEGQIEKGSSRGRENIKSPQASPKKGSPNKKSQLRGSKHSQPDAENEEFLSSGDSTPEVNRYSSNEVTPSPKKGRRQSPAKGSPTDQASSPARGPKAKPSKTKVNPTKEPSQKSSKQLKSPSPSKGRKKHRLTHEELAVGYTHLPPKHLPMDCELGEGEEELLAEGEEEEEELAKYIELPEGMKEQEFLEYLKKGIEEGVIDIADLGMTPEDLEAVIEHSGEEEDDEEGAEEMDDTEFIDMEAVDMPAYMFINDPQDRIEYFKQLDERYFQELEEGKRTPKHEGAMPKNVNFGKKNRVKSTLPPHPRILQGGPNRLLHEVPPRVRQVQISRPQRLTLLINLLSVLTHPSTTPSHPIRFDLFPIQPIE
jgi:hypothetical protein